jgi:hypothetical protein
MNTITANFNCSEDAERAMNKLLVRGWHRVDMSLLTHNSMAMLHGRSTSGIMQNSAQGAAHCNTDPGFVTVGFVGGIIGLLIGIVALMVLGDGPVLVTDTPAMVVVSADTGAALSALIGTPVGIVVGAAAPGNDAVAANCDRDVREHREPWQVEIESGARGYSRFDNKVNVL